MQGVSLTPSSVGSMAAQAPLRERRGGGNAGQIFFGDPFPCCPVGQARWGGCPELGSAGQGVSSIPRPVGHEASQGPPRRHTCRGNAGQFSRGDPFPCCPAGQARLRLCPELWSAEGVWTVLHAKVRPHSEKSLSGGAWARELLVKISLGLGRPSCPSWQALGEKCPRAEASRTVAAEGNVRI